MKDFLKTVSERIDPIKFLTAAVVLGVFFMITSALIYRQIPASNQDILIHLLGIVEGAVMTLVTFEFGSSKGSQKKDEVIETLTDKTKKE